MPDCVGVLELQGYGLAFGDKVVVPAVDLNVFAVGCTVLLGLAGAGKSVLLRALAGRTPPSRSLRIWGQARYLGQPCTLNHRPLLVLPSVQQLSVSVQDGLIAEMAGRERLTRAAQLERVFQGLQHHGLMHLADHLRTKLIDLPLLEQRLLMVLRGVLAQPAVLCLDEPLQGLSPQGLEVMAQLLRRVARERALLVTLASEAEASMLGGDVVWLDEMPEAEPIAFSDSALYEPPQLAAVAPSPAVRPVPVVAVAAAPTVPEPEMPPGLGQTMAQAWSRAVTRRASAGPAGFYWLLPGQLAGTPWPGVVHDARYDLDVLRNVGITLLISLTEVPFDPQLAAEFGIRCVASPMPDMAPPSLEQALQLCHTIDRALAANQVVAVHCHAGLGRTGTVLVCYALWRAQGRQTGAEALAQARRIHPGWVQSSAQVQFLDAFAQHLGSGSVSFSSMALG